MYTNKLFRPNPYFFGTLFYFMYFECLQLCILGLHNTGLFLFCDLLQELFSLWQAIQNRRYTVCQVSTMFHHYLPLEVATHQQWTQSKPFYFFLGLNIICLIVWRMLQACHLFVCGDIMSLVYAVIYCLAISNFSRTVLTIQHALIFFSLWHNFFQVYSLFLKAYNVERT